jgi:N-methylhydantoinase B
MRIDPVTLEIIKNGFIFAAQEMNIIVVKTAYSSVVREVLDVSCSIFDRNGRAVAQASAIPIHLGSMQAAIKEILSAHIPQREWEEGDVIIVNEPYLGGTHLPDIMIFSPVFFEGEMVSISGTVAHHADVGGMSPGSTPANATSIYQEGLRIPPVKLYRKGELNDDLCKVYRMNVRRADVGWGDISAQIAANNTGATRVLELFSRYGKEPVLRYIEEILDYSERRMRYVIRRWKDGIYENTDYMDDDGVNTGKPVKIHVTAEVKGDEVYIDFEGTSPAVDGPINAVVGPTLSAVYYVINSLGDPDIPPNEGCNRPVHVNLPRGTLVNPDPPHACNARTQTCHRITDTLLDALSKAFPEKGIAGSTGQLNSVTFGGIHPDTQREYVDLETIGGGLGARYEKDGLSGIDTHVTNCMNTPVEAWEMELPVRINRYELIQDSGGPGKFRGGLAPVREYHLWGNSAILTIRSERHTFPPKGIFGGKDAQSCRSILKEPGKRDRTLPHLITRKISEGSTLTCYLSGGGGYFSPWERDPQKVLDDVLDGYVSIESAERDYCVSIDPVTMRIKEEETKLLRDQAKSTAKQE